MLWCKGWVGVRGGYILIQCPREGLSQVHVDDELIAAVLDSLPRSAVTTGVPTLSSVKQRFRVVKEETRKAGLAPENAPPVLAHMIGNFLAMVSMQPTVAISGEGIEAVLSRAAAHVDSGDLSAALEEVDDIKASGDLRGHG